LDPARAQDIATRQIEPGERLLWSGAPAPGAAALGALPASLFGIPFTGFAVFWIWGAATAATHAPGPWALFPLFGTPFLLIGLGMLAAPLWAAMRAGSTVYAVTERRALIILRGGAGGVTSYSHAELQQLMRIERPDGSGSLFFAWQASPSTRAFQQFSRVGFVGIADVRRVERLIRENILRDAA
jgi:hypothetical protein